MTSKARFGGQLRSERQSDFLQDGDNNSENMDQNIPHEIHLTTLPGGAGKSLPDRSDQTSMSI